MSKQSKKTVSQPQPLETSETLYQLKHFPAVAFDGRIINRGETVTAAELNKMDKCVLHAFVKVE